METNKMTLPIGTIGNAVQAYLPGFGPEVTTAVQDSSQEIKEVLEQEGVAVSKKVIGFPVQETEEQVVSILEDEETTVGELGSTGTDDYVITPLNNREKPTGGRFVTSDGRVIELYEDDEDPADLYGAWRKG